MLRDSFFTLILHGLFAALGGIVREMKDDDTHVKEFRDFITGAFIGVFSGLVVYFICKNFEVGEYLTIAMVGLAGYAGTPILDWITKLVKTKVKNSL